MAESLVVAAAKLLGSAAWREVNQLRRFDRDLDDMERKLLDIGAVLHDAGEQSLELREGDVVRLWLPKLRSVACDIQDVLGDHQAKTDRFHESTIMQKAKQICSSSNPLLVKRNISSSIKELKKRLNEVADDPLVGRFKRQPSSVHVKNERFVPESDNDIVGRSEDILTIRQLLEQGAENGVPILPIVGIGGVGKSSTARKIFEKATKFDLKIWVTVTKDFDWKNITRSILEDGATTVSPPNEYNLQIKLIKEKLENRKCMIVLDDLWNENHGALDQLKHILESYTGKGSQAIVTTRNTNVGRLIWNITPPYKLEFLSNDDCWKLFSRMALPDNTRDRRSKEDVGRRLVQKCSGLPLLVSSLGSSMRQKETIEAWKDVNDHDIWSLVAPSLKLSYYHMPPRQKQCFLYCALFPEGSEINKQNLMQQWVALDMVESAEADECLRGLMNIHFLVHANEPTQVDASVINEPEVLRMHDMVHKLAKSIGENFVLTTRASEEKVTPHHRNNLDCRYAQLSSYNREDKLDHNCLPPKTRALHFLNCHIGRVPFKDAKYLRVLDLSGSSFERFPASVCDLKYLRYLYASGTAITKLPRKFTKLGNLQFLDLSNTSLEVLPSDFRKLRKLLSLNLSNCRELTELPDCLGESGSIEILDLSHCTKIVSLPNSICELKKLEWLNLSNCEQLSRLPQLFGNLTSLGHLNISGCSLLEQLPESFANLTSLNLLDLSNCSELQGRLRTPIGRFSGLELEQILANIGTSA